MELRDDIYARVTSLSATANELMEEGKFAEAIKVFDQALLELPEPKASWEASMWLNASIGDAQFQLRNFAEAKEAMFDAINCLDGVANSFILLRLGEALFELGDRESAREYLLRAFMVAGDELFKADLDRPYLEFLRSTGVL